MSQENLEMVRAAFDAFNQMGNWDSAFADAAPDFELDMSRSIAPMRGVYSLEETPKLLNELTAGFLSPYVSSRTSSSSCMSTSSCR
jgi:hypothetical protein